MQIIIDGVNITNYIQHQGIKWSRNDVDGPNAGRNLKGRMIRDRVATKIRLDITCRPLTAAEHTRLLNAILPEYVTVNYTDPMYGNVSKVMYSNNNSSEHCVIAPDGVEYWHNISFPLIEV